MQIDSVDSVVNWELKKAWVPESGPTSGPPLEVRAHSTSGDFTAHAHCAAEDLRTVLVTAPLHRAVNFSISCLLTDIQSTALLMPNA